jgi:phospholipid-binding lipoprotein MlaA
MAGRRSGTQQPGGLRFVDIRASLLPADKVVEEAALDKYAYIRDAYLQRRRNQIFDGRPPRLDD